MDTASGAQPEGDPWVETGVRLAKFTKLQEEGLVREFPCLACGYPTLDARGHDHICVVCHWRDDGSTREAPDQRSAANHGLTLRQATVHIAEGGVFASAAQLLPGHEYFTRDVRAARADLVDVYEQLGQNPADPAIRAAIRVSRARFMRAIVNEMP